MGCNEPPTERILMTDIPKSAVITIKVINAVDSMFARLFNK